MSIDIRKTTVVWLSEILSLAQELSSAAESGDVAETVRLLAQVTLSEEPEASETVRLIEVKRLQSVLRKREDELKPLVFDEHGTDANTIVEEGRGTVTILGERKTVGLNVVQACANLLQLRLLGKTRKEHLTQLVEALKSGGHKVPMRTTRVSASIRVSANL